MWGSKGVGWRGKPPWLYQFALITITGHDRRGAPRQEGQEGRRVRLRDGLPSPRLEAGLKSYPPPPRKFLGVVFKVP